MSTTLFDKPNLENIFERAYLYLISLPFEYKKFSYQWHHELQEREKDPRSSHAERLPNFLESTNLSVTGKGYIADHLHH